ncbi:hypothetical protein [Dyella nitratireducens]|uniref:Uncharacterized protein n=1 Tax=Dyella nitratireducens TaxID=1849580 RepID=A0ABQ1FW35_9GAMM|nr:hypothetical protein [Dyella nitratireducens]GGA29552.1 hypothetical protein GCM10010981_18130 [Dyella nitratireducens]GLQ43123.1 hypothetical protein GCM10007902_29730 [Dyella nitratireducens]
MKRPIPPRIHVLLARDAAAAVVVRRGPTRHTALIGWDRKTDTFKIGQWLYGRIYERRCDLSPDGKHLIYFAMNGRWKSSAKGSWTAISKAPYLKAVSLFAKGDCWHGGGLFQTSTDYWLNDGYGHELQEEDRRLRRVVEYPWHEQYGGECPGVYYIRLQRDGWLLKHSAPNGDGDQVSVFEKRVNNHWILRKRAHTSLGHSVGRGVYFDTHELFNSRTEEVVSKIDWEWAELDGTRLIWAANGCLHSGWLDVKGLLSEKLLHDFSPMQFEKLEAPY